MVTYSNIAGQEPSTVTFRAATVQISRGSTTEQQEIVVLGDPATSNAQVAVVATTPSSNAWGLVVRPIFSSTAADNTVLAVQGTSPWTIAGNSTVVIASGNSSVIVSNWSSVFALAAFPPGMTSTSAPVSGDTGLFVRQVGYVAPTTNVVVTGTVTVQGNSTVVVASGNSSVIITAGNSSVTVSAFPSGMTSTAAPASGDTGLFVRQIGYVAPTTNVVVTGTVTVQGNSTVMQGTSPWIIAGNSTVVVASGNSSVTITAGNSSVIITAGNSSVTITAFPAGMISTAAPASGDTGIFVRQVGYVAPTTNVVVSGTVTIQGNSTVLQGTNPWTIAGNSTVVIASGNSSVIIASGNSSVTVSNTVTIQGNSTVMIGTNLQSTSAPSSNSSGLIVRQVTDNILVAFSSNAFASTSLTIASSVAGVRVYVQGYSILTTAAGPTTVKFYAGSSVIWPLVFATPTSAVSGANLAVSAPAYLFRGDVGGPMTLQTASSAAGWKVAVSYFVGP